MKMKFFIKDYITQWCTVVDDEGYIYPMRYYRTEDEAHNNLYRDSLRYIDSVMLVSPDQTDYLKSKRDAIVNQMNQLLKE